MKKTSTVMNVIFIALMAISILQTSCSSLNQKLPDNRDMVLWYNKPAQKVWLDGLFIGNGYMGANVFGRVYNERIALNESTFWSGFPHDYTNPEGYKYFPDIRDLVFEGKYKEAEKVANEHFYGIPANQQAYQPIGDLLLNFKNSENVTDYYRELDMETGIAKITYKDGDAKFTREIFMSFPDHVMVIHLTCDKPNNISLEGKFKSPYLEKVVASSGKLIMKGIWKGPLPKNALSGLIANVEGTGLKFQTTLLALPENGEQSISDTSLTIKNATSVTLILTTATSFKNYTDISGDPAITCEKILSHLASKDYKALLKNHENDFTFFRK